MVGLYRKGLLGLVIQNRHVSNQSESPGRMRTGNFLSRVVISVMAGPAIYDYGSIHACFRSLNTGDLFYITQP